MEQVADGIQGLRPTGIRAPITARGYSDRIHTIKTHCANPCEHGFPSARKRN